MLTECDTDVAATHLLEFLDDITTVGEVFQFAILQLIRTVCGKRPDERAR